MKTTRMMAAALIVASGLASHVLPSHARSSHGPPLGETVTVAADEPIPNYRGSAWSAISSTTPLGRARPRTVTPARPSSMPTSSLARSGASSMVSRPASTGPARRGSRTRALTIG